MNVDTLARIKRSARVEAALQICTLGREPKDGFLQGGTGDSRVFVFVDEDGDEMRCGVVSPRPFSTGVFWWLWTVIPFIPGLRCSWPRAF